MNFKISTRLQADIIILFMTGNFTEQKIADHLRCNISHVSVTVQNHLSRLRTEKLPELLNTNKTIVEPFVLLTENQLVLNAYQKMINK